MAKFLLLTLMSGDEAFVNMERVEAVLPASAEDKETRPDVNSYLPLANGNVLNVKELPADIMARMNGH